MRSQYFSITFPRRFGKTFNLDLIKTYFEIEHSNGIELKPQDKINRYLFENGTIDENGFRKKMKICDSQEFEEDFGKHPVLHFTFLNVLGDNYFDLLGDLATQIKQVLEKYQFLTNRSQESKNSDRLIRQYDALYEICQNPRSLPTTKLKASLVESIYLLTQMLYNHFGEKDVVLLIDEFDCPLNNAFKKFNSDDLSKAIDLIKGNHTIF